MQLISILLDECVKSVYAAETQFYIDGQEEECNKPFKEEMVANDDFKVLAESCTLEKPSLYLTILEQEALV